MTMSGYQPEPNALLLSSSRLRKIQVIIVLLFLGIVLRVIYLLQTQQVFLENQGDSRALKTIILAGQRGEIRDSRGVLLAKNIPASTFWVNPKNSVPPTGGKLEALAKLLELPKTEIITKWQDKKKGFVFIKQNVEDVVSDQVVKLSIAGLNQEKIYKRYYPESEVGAQLIGLTGSNGEGQEGLELSKDKVLLGSNGSRAILRDRTGKILEDVQPIETPINGKTLVLSIDQRIQNLAYDALQSSVKKNNAKAGSAIVLDGKTGEVLAMVNYPSFNPNLKQIKINPASLRNRAVIDNLEPGSTMKPFVVAMGIESGKITPNTVFNTNSFMIGRATVRDTHPKSAMSVSEVIQKSSNVGTAKVAQLFPPKAMWAFYDKLGFGRALNIDFPGTTKGSLRSWEKWRPIEQATMSFGYGVSVNLLQMVRAYTIFSNNGKILPVTLFKLNAPPVGERIISEKTAKTMREMLAAVTQKGGTATLAQVLGYTVAGKTGTARKLVGGRYVDDKHMSLFVGFAPASAPRLIVAVMVDEPKGGNYYGGTVSAPVFANIMTGSLRLLGVSADAPDNTMPLPLTNLEDVNDYVP
ncbi:MAG: penicillin-binding protein 2 [Neisseriaceae bacterium]|nr:penicillin-binding protein 2 [Neisseriaceae bacterium]